MKKILVVAAIIVAATGYVTNTSMPVSAAASGCQAWGAKTVGNIPIAKGTYCVGLNGSGTRVDNVFGQFTSVGNVCNWSITMEYFDSAGRWYRTWSSTTRNSCSPRGEVRLRFASPFTAKRGSMCSTLKQNGQRITSVCHSIH